MRQLLLLAMLCTLIGCTRVTVFGHQVKDGPATSRNAPAPARQQVARIVLEFTPAAKQQVDADVRFDADALRDAINAALQSRGMLDRQAAGVGRVAVIQLDEFAVRATSNVVLFGRLPSAGLLAGAVSIRDPAAGKLPDLPVRADIALNIPQRGAGKQPLQNLYDRFATLVAEGLGAAAPR